MQRAEKDKEKQARVMAAQSREIELLEALVANQEGMISQRDVHIEGLQALLWPWRTRSAAGSNSAIGRRMACRWACYGGAQRTETCAARHPCSSW